MLDLIISTAYAEAVPAAPAPQGSAISQLILLGGMLLIFYFILWRPQAKQRKEHKSLIDNLTKGDEVVMSGGILGKIIKVDELYSVIEIANNVQIKVQKAAVMASLPKGTLKAIN